MTEPCSVHHLDKLSALVHEILPEPYRVLRGYQMRTIQNHVDDFQGQLPPQRPRVRRGLHDRAPDPVPPLDGNRGSARDRYGGVDEEEHQDLAVAWLRSVDQLELSDSMLVEVRERDRAALLRRDLTDLLRGRFAPEDII